MRVALASIFQDSTSYLERYIGQVRLLRETLEKSGHVFRSIWIEGDSSDTTLAMLLYCEQWCNAHIGTHSHNGPKYGSVDDIGRWRQLAPVLNATLEAVIPEDDAVIYVESDLIWEPETMLRLLGRLDDYPAVGGLIYHAAGFYYDTYAYRMNGQRFSSQYQPESAEPFRIDSVGSCIVMRGEVARACRFGADTCLIGESLRDHGYELWVDPTCRIVHP